MQHAFTAAVEWTGNTGHGTATYRSYERRYEIQADGKPSIPGSSDPAFGGDRSRYNPEDLLVASLSSCHMLWYLGLCGKAGVVVTAYLDRAEGTMVLDPSGSGRFTRVVLRPKVTVAPGTDLERARRLHHEANAMCFIANSVSFPVGHEPVFEIGPADLTLTAAR